MAKSKQEVYERNRNTLKRYNEDGEVSDEEYNHIVEAVDANDPDRHMTQMPDGGTKAPGTLAAYCHQMGRVARDLDVDLTEATPRDINLLMQGYLTGEVESVTKDGGLSKGSVSKMQAPMRIFYRYHADLGVDPEEITLTKREETHVDPRDIFDPEDVEALRGEAKETGLRDAALIDLLLYTGQRRRAILNLRLKDVDVDEGVFYLNEDDGDLKGASGKRPLLGALQSVRQWKRQHPTGDPNDYLITQRYAQGHREDVDMGSRLSDSTVHYLLKRIGRDAGVDKPVNPHQFRHYFVTVCKRDYGMDNDTIKHLIGHEPGSTVMETTYAHLTDDDYIQKAEEKTGISEPEDESPLTPPVCDRCNEPLESDWKSCPYCGMVYAPDAQQTKEQIEEDLWQSKSEVEPGSRKDEALDDLRDYLKQNPAAMNKLIEDMD